MEKIDVSKPVYFYDDRNKYDWMLKLVSVLYQDGDVCLAIAEGTEPELQIKEKILFNVNTGIVNNEDYYSWRATNDMAWAIPKDEELRQRGRIMMERMANKE